MQSQEGIIWHASLKRHAWPEGPLTSLAAPTWPAGWRVLADSRVTCRQVTVLTYRALRKYVPAASGGGTGWEGEGCEKAGAGSSRPQQVHS